ncbi:hypothetical protein ACQW02_17915 [Humitalea sp. 24SJ18S-53]|uniref:hypothetical protein n=1 Tax=Humitalea sp. 24SJ18S-53 TaxID=3422307 RepID=UPI003D6705CD
MLSRRLTALGLAVLPFAAFAQGAGPARIRGTIVSFEAGQLTIATREGGRATVTLPETAPVSALRRVALSEVTPGTFLGVVAEPGPDGGLQAIAISVFPPGARGREFQSAWDLGPNTSMNNGAVEAVVENANGREITMTILGQSHRVAITPRTALLMGIPATRADLVPGAAVLVVGTRAEDGRITVDRMQVGRDGVSPAT